LHPLRNAEFIDIFPFLKVFEHPEIKSARENEIVEKQNADKVKK
jgi:hypothetical protein